MSTQYGKTPVDGNTLVAEATPDELELNIETLQDLEVDASQVKGGALAVAVGDIRLSGTSVISGPSLNPSGG
jgi:hypothetical protein